MACNDTVCGTGGWAGPLPGDPDNSSVLTALGTAGGVILNWTLPGINSHAVSYVSLYRAQSDNFSLAMEIAAAGGNTYFDRIPEDEMRQYFYWMKIVSVNGTEGSLIGPASAIPFSSVEELVAALSTRIDESFLAQQLRTRIDLLEVLQGDLAQEIQNRVANNSSISEALAGVQLEVGEALSFLQAEISQRVDGQGSLLDSINALTVGMTDLSDDLVAEQQARADDITAEATARTTALVNEAAARNAAIAQEAQDRIAAVTAEATARTAAITAEQIARAQAVLDEATARGTAITNEATLRAQGDTQLASQITTLTAVVNGNTAAIATEQTARSNADSATATVIETLAASTEAIRAATAALVVSEVSARTTADTALAQDISVLAASVDTNTAAITTETTARAAADAAEATQREQLATQFRGDYTGTDVAALTSGLLYQERIARAAADAGLSQQITLLSAGAGEQFDYKQIYYFDSGVEGWEGNGTPTATGGWLKPANHATDAYVTSPTGLALDANTYGQVRLRIRKTGNPVWEGQLWWRFTGDASWLTGQRVTVTEPTYDANGIGLITVNPAWTGSIDRIRLDISVGQSATDYFQLDWVAIGRPSPGASSAALLAEQTARASADASEVTARQALSSKLTGVNDPSSLTLATLASGLLYEERQARSTQDTALSTSITSLQATVNTNNTNQTAAVTAEATARANADTSLANQISTVSAGVAGKNKVFVQASSPAATANNDIWLDSDDGNKPYIWNGSAWVETTDARILANTAAIIAEQSARATAVSAEATSREALATQIRGGHTGTNLSAVTSGLIYEERQARTTADTAEATARASLAATVASNHSAQTAAIASEATVRANADSALTTQFNALTATVDTNMTNAAALVSGEATARADADMVLSERVDVTSAMFDAIRAATAAMVVSETVSRSTQDMAFTQSLNVLTATVDTDRANANAMNLAESTARSTADMALSTSINALTATVNLNDSTTQAALLAESAARASADSAITTQVNSLISTVNTDRTNAQALVSTESTARANADSAMATDIAALTATTNANSAAIQTEQTARTTAINAVTSSVTALTATVAGKAKTYRQTSAPTAGMLDGDLWFDSDDSNKAYRYSGSSWVATDDTRIATNAAAIVTEATARATADTALSAQITTAQTTLNNSIASVQTSLQTNITAVDDKVEDIGALYTVKVDVNGLVGGFGVYNDGTQIDAGFDVDYFWVGKDGVAQKPFIVLSAPQILPSGKTIPAGVYMNKAFITQLDADQIDTRGLSIRDASGNIILAAGTPLNWANVGGSGKPADNATVGASFGVNIGGKITPTNVSTYIDDAAIKNAQIADAAITNAKIGNLEVTAAKIANAAITNAKIGNLAVDTLNIADNAVTVPVSAYTAAAVDTTSSGNTTVQTITITGTGAPAIIHFTLLAKYPSSSTTQQASISVFRDAVELYNTPIDYSMWSGSVKHTMLSGSIQDAVTGTATYTLVVKCTGASVNAKQRSLYRLETKK
jgi:hypothetical protein